MATDKQIAAAQRNGALSRGPITPRGKAKSCLNAIRHGLSATLVVVSNEDRAAYNALRRKFLTDLAPRNALELSLAMELVNVRWRMLRATAMETALYDHEMDQSAATLDARYAQIDEPTRLALSFKSITESSPSFQHLDRHEARLHRTFLRLLDKYQSLHREPLQP